MGKKKRSSSGKSQDVKTEQGKSWLIMNQVKPPDPFNFQESASWPTWIKRYRMFHSAVGLASAGEDQQINMLLYCMGPEAEELLDSLGMTEGKRTSFNSVVTAFEDYFMIKKNAFYYRALFMERNQKSGEKVDSYIDDLRKLSEKCEWSCKNCKCKDFRDEIILIKLITGLNDKNVSKRLQRQEVTTLAACVKALKESEVGGEKGVDDDVSTEFTTVGIGRKNTSPGHSSKWENKSSVGEDITSVSFTPSAQHREVASPTCSLPKLTLQEEKGNMRSSFSSGVDTGDEYAMDELSYNSYFYITGENHDGFYDVGANSKRNASSATTTSFCEDQRLKSCGCRVVNCAHMTRERESGSTANRKLGSWKEKEKESESGSHWWEIGKRASAQWWPDNGFDTDEDDEYLENLYDFHQKNCLSLTSDKTCSSVKATFKLDDSWPELEKTIANVDDKPKPYENNYYFNVSGRTSRKSLRKMCQQQLKFS